MTGAMYAAVSGLKAHMSKLNVIGNNIANVNTYAYKAGRVTFLESIYTSVRSGSDGTDVLGGTNPAQVGYGASIGTIDLDMSSKSFSPTGWDMDCMIDGDGFFFVGDKVGSVSDGADLASLKLTRLGNFGFKDGYLVDGQGNVVYGFLSAGAGNGSSSANYNVTDGTPPTAINPDQSMGVSTQLVPIRLPLSATAGDPADPAAPKEGSAIYPYWDADAGQTVDSTENVNADGTRVQLNSIGIDKTGKIVGTNQATGDVVVVGYVPIACVDNPGGVTHLDGSYYQALGGAGGVRIASIGNSVKGYLGNKLVDGITGSRDAIIGTGDTELRTGGLESSGTDLSSEITEMITTQRGYQANTRIITVTDSMLEELVNMKR